MGCEYPAAIKGTPPQRHKRAAKLKRAPLNPTDAITVDLQTAGQQEIPTVFSKGSISTLTSRA